MQLLTLPEATTLSQLSKRVGDRNMDRILSENSLTRQPNIGKAFLDLTNEIISTFDIDNDAEFAQRKASVLNSLTSDSDIFEAAALLGNHGWSVLSSLGTLPGRLKIPDSVSIPDAYDVMGNGTPISRDIYDQAVSQIREAPYTVDPSIFNTFSSSRSSNIIGVGSVSNPMQWFDLPWGKITLYSSIINQSIDFPVYPEQLGDGRVANYDTMPDMLYQYEPFNVYKSSGPRSNSYEFNLHRDMWTGDHNDGKCYELINFCEANCYPEYKGAAVHMPTVALYLSGNLHISGILTRISTSWEGPLGHDNFYLQCKLVLDITEESPEPLDYWSIMNRRNQRGSSI